MKFKTSLYWFRNDLRLTDNPALSATVQESESIFPIYIFDPSIFKSSRCGAPSVAFLLQSLESLQKNIEAAGGHLFFRIGDPVEILDQWMKETRATALFFSRDYLPYERERDAKVISLAKNREVTIRSFKSGMIEEPEEILKSDGTPYHVFTAYARVWREKTKNLSSLPPVKSFKKNSFKLSGETALPTLFQLGFKLAASIPDGGEKTGLKLFRDFAKNALADYDANRNFPAIEGTSRLSPHLRFGTISPRFIVAQINKILVAKNGSKGRETFVKELIWRDFYRQILWHYPHTEKSCFRAQYDHLPWKNDERHFSAWCNGRTGFPIVDAAMRQLNATGWMHNRLRMIVASFLTKDLLIDWKWGEQYFMQRLVDADSAANIGGWQWSSGVGTDAQPFFRIFNPTSQAEKFDPQGKFIERLVPEANLLTYPAPIVDHAKQRIKALALYKKL